MTEMQTITQLRRLEERFKMWACTADWLRAVRESYCTVGHLKQVVDALCSGTGDKPTLADLVRRLQPYRDTQPTPGATFDPTTGQRLYRCAACRDSGLMYAIVHVRQHDSEVLSMVFCNRCEVGKLLSAQHRPESHVHRCPVTVVREFDTYDAATEWQFPHMIPPDAENKTSPSEGKGLDQLVQPVEQHAAQGNVVDVPVPVPEPEPEPEPVPDVPDDLPF